MRLRWLALVPLLAGCIAGAHPVYISCKGEGTVTGQSQALMYAGSFVITAKCGDGFEYEGRKFRPKDQVTPTLPPAPPKP